MLQDIDKVECYLFRLVNGAIDHALAKDELSKGDKEYLGRAWYCAALTCEFSKGAADMFALNALIQSFVLSLDMLKGSKEDTGQVLASVHGIAKQEDMLVGLV